MAPRSVLLLLLCAIAVGCGEGRSTRASPPLRLIALQIRAGNPPHYGRAFVVLRENGAVEHAIRLRLLRGMQAIDLATSRVGRRMLATVTRSASDERRADIFSFGNDGSQRRRLTTSGDSGRPSPSPDGRLLAYSRLGGAGFERARLWIMGADGSDRRRLVSGGGDLIDLAGSWAPDGRRLAFTRCHVRPYGSHDFEDGCSVYSVAQDGGGLRRLADSAFLPDWSPDGRRIAFQSTRDHTALITADSDTNRYAAELYVMNADGGDQRRLTTTRSLDESGPRWSPGGTRIGYTRRGESFRTRLFQINADGTCTTAITAARDLRFYRLVSWQSSSRAHEDALDCA
jgi:Tol biopolymer transport system component